MDEMSEKIKKRTPREHLDYSWMFLAVFYISLAILYIISLLFDYDLNLKIALGILLVGNFLIAAFSQLFNYIIEIQFEGESEKNEFRDWAYMTFLGNCFVRCVAGIFEVIFYSFSFALNFGTFVIGYFVIKNISIWKSQAKDGEKKDQAKEGCHTAVFRIVTVSQLFLSAVVAYYLFHFLHNYQNIFNFTLLNRYSIFK